MAKPSRVLTLADLGEDALLARLLRRLPSGGDVLSGPGDDCAIVGRRRDRRWQLLKTDCVVQGVHFLPGAEPRRVGWKVLCRAISDIAAMGGVPRHALITVAAPRSTPVEWMRELYAGLRRAARKFAVSIVGGETARSNFACFINAALTGEVEPARCVRRSGGKPGDLLFVTGRLGGSLLGKHLDFTPRLAEGRWLSEHFRLSAMMDLSDGLGADLPRLARASGCGFELDEEAVPRTPGCSLPEALTDGEDYELLFALPPRYTKKLTSEWPLAFPRLPLSCIGRLVSHPITRPLHSRGYDHFRQTV